MEGTKEEREIREDTLKDVIMLLDLAIRRSGASRCPDEDFRAGIRGPLVAARRELSGLEPHPEPRSLVEVHAG